MEILSWTVVACLEAKAQAISLAVPQRLNTKKPYDPTIPLQEIHPREVETHIDTKTWTQKFMVAALFLIAEKYKPPKYPSTDEWINKMCYMPTLNII